MKLDRAEQGVAEMFEEHIVSLDHLSRLVVGRVAAFFNVELQHRSSSNLNCQVNQHSRILISLHNT